MTLVTNIGTEIKAVGHDGRTQGYLVRFGTDQDFGDMSLFRDIFQAPPKTYYGRATKVDTYVHHGMLPEFGPRELTNQAEIEIDKVGVFVKHLLNLRDPYEKALYGLVRQNKLGWSSGSSSHLVARKAISGGRHLISRWPITEASYTPCPASGGGTEVTAAAMKSLLLEAGVTPSKAALLRELNELDRARRLSLECALLHLED